MAGTVDERLVMDSSFIFQEIEGGKVFYNEIKVVNSVVALCGGLW